MLVRSHPQPVLRGTLVVWYGCEDGFNVSTKKVSIYMSKYYVGLPLTGE